MNLTEQRNIVVAIYLQFLRRLFWKPKSLSDVTLTAAMRKQIIPLTYDLCTTVLCFAWAENPSVSILLSYQKTVRFPALFRIFRVSQTCVEAIFKQLLAVPDSNLPEASGAAVPISVLLLRRFAAIGGARFRTFCIKGRSRLFHNGLL